MSKKKFINKRPVTESEKWRVSLLADWGFYYSTIAKRLYGNGNPRYTPSDSEVKRVGKIARQEGTSSLNYRRGENAESRNILTPVLRSEKFKQAKQDIKKTVSKQLSQ